jgi:hypothetical protein
MEVTDPNDPLIDLADQGGKSVSDGGAAGATFVDLFPAGELHKIKPKYPMDIDCF